MLTYKWEKNRLLVSRQMRKVVRRSGCPGCPHLLIEAPEHGREGREREGQGGGLAFFVIFFC